MKQREQAQAAVGVGRAVIQVQGLDVSGFGGGRIAELGAPAKHVAEEGIGAGRGEALARVGVEGMIGVDRGGATGAAGAQQEEDKEGRGPPCDEGAGCRETPRRLWMRWAR